MDSNCINLKSINTHLIRIIKVAQLAKAKWGGWECVEHTCLELDCVSMMFMRGLSVI